MRELVSCTLLSSLTFRVGMYSYAIHQPYCLHNFEHRVDREAGHFQRVFRKIRSKYQKQVDDLATRSSHVDFLVSDCQLWEKSHDDQDCRLRRLWRTNSTGNLIQNYTNTIQFSPIFWHLTACTCFRSSLLQQQDWTGWALPILFRAELTLLRPDIIVCALSEDWECQVIFRNRATSFECNSSL